jgi:hypothetical protein
VRTRQSKNTNAALAACDVLDDSPVQSATRGGGGGGGGGADTPDLLVARLSPVRWTDSHARIKRQEAASDAVIEPAEPASQARWS